jgi:alpha-amylase/alpha-mannosidase (GH57 family)
MRFEPAHVAFLWHHHQPDYRDPAAGRPIMPWVRLHALRGYRDLAVLLLEEEVPMTVNLVPSLLDQLQWYAGGGDDPHLALTARPAAELAPDERARVLESFIAGHPAMIGQHPAYRRLRALRDAGELTAVGDLRDLQVWSTLAWVGFSGLRDHPELATLRAKGRDFTEADKALMLATCARMVGEIAGLYAELASREICEISASAYYHPILPLLIDTDHARRNLPEPADPAPFSRPGDALAQLRRGRARVEEVIGVPVSGLWPSEGSVSPELLQLVREAGFRWLVSDEEVLTRSAHQRTAPGRGSWDLGGLRGFFRDRDLSDAVGFRYARRDPDEAAAELLGALRQRPGITTVALDGENPWESFEDAGEGFLRALCRGLRERRGVSALTFSRACAEAPVGRVARLHTGSWIGANFAIWFGDREDRDAWRLLAEAREAVAAAGDPPVALEHLLAAEGSDWFWWYGPEFDTPFAPEFDRLFRAHLAAAWAALGQPVPAALSRPIRAPRGRSPAVRAPRGEVRPALRAGPQPWAAWAGAGLLDCARPGGSMSPGARHLDAVVFGVDGDGLAWLRLDRSGNAPRALEGGEWEVVSADGTSLVRWPYGARGAAAEESTAVEGVASDGERAVVRLRLAPGAGVAVRVLRAGLEVARYPAAGWLNPDQKPAPWWV